MAEPAIRQRRAVAPRVVFAGLVLSFVLAGGVALWIYVRYVAYERVAARHVPDAAAALVRIDLEQVVTYEPFRRHLLPLVLRGGRDERLKPRLDRLQHHTGVELGVDIRELVYAAGRDARHWSLAVGGVFPKSGVPRGLYRVLDEEGVFTELTVNQLSFPTGARMAQAADGVVLFASDAGTLASALRPGDRQQKLGLPETGAVAVALDADAFSSEVRQRLGRRLGFGLDGMRLSARLFTKKPMRCEVRAELGRGRTKPGDLVMAVRRLTGLPESEVETEQASDGAFQLAFPISSEHLDGVARVLSRWLSEQLSLPPDRTPQKMKSGPT